MDTKIESLTRKEIESKLSVVGDYVKMDYLQSCLKKHLDFDTKRFVLLKLSNIYESRKMYLESGKLMRIAADINTTFEGKMNDFVKSVDLFIKSGNYNEADISFNKATALANERQKLVIKIKVKDFYKSHSKDLINKDKRKHAMEAYEKILTLDLDPIEKKEVQSTLLELYQKLGKINDYYSLKRNI